MVTEFQITDTNTPSKTKKMFIEFKTICLPFIFSFAVELFKALTNETLLNQNITDMLKFDLKLLLNCLKYDFLSLGPQFTSDYYVLYIYIYNI